MKKMQKLIAVLTAATLFSAVEAAQAQRLLNGIGSRLGARNAAAANAEINMDEGVVIEEAADAQAASVGIGATRAVAQPQAAAQTSAAQGQQAAQSSAITKSDGSEFVIPANATIEQLIAQANKLLETEVAFETEEEFNDWVGKMLLTIGKIGDAVLKMKPNDEQFVQAISLKGQALCYQASIDSSALTKLDNYASALEKNKRVQSLEEGRQAAMAFKGVFLQAKVAEVAERNGTSAELTAVMKEVAAFIAEHPETSDMTVDLVFPVKVVAENQKDAKLPAQIWTPIRKQLAASDSQDAKAALQLLEGTIRYSELEGKSFEWFGYDANGEKFDPKKVEGKVVLVDFWAGWNESCAAVHTQLKPLYEKYHDLGFEIVGYDLDAKTEDMQKYVEKNNIPWLILSDRATVDAKATSLAAYYGISEIPTMVLIGGDGKVAALDISVESLTATLESVFAQVSAAASAKAGTASAASSASSKPAAAKSGSAASSGKTVSPARKSNAPTTIKKTK